MTTATSGIVVLLMTAGVLSLIHGISLIAFDETTRGALVVCLGAACTVPAFLLGRNSGSGA